jgi:3-oxoacyl-[acyl-carrier-protein] synthase II
MVDDQAVVITGIGALCPLGTGFSEISENLLAGRSGIRTVDDLDVAEHPSRIAGRVTLPACPPQCDAASYEGLFPLDRCVLSCCAQALRDAGMWDQRQSPRIGLVLGLAAEWMLHWDFDARRGGSLLRDSAPRRHATIDATREALGLTGPSLSVAAACASGNHALSHASHWLRRGWVDVCLAGACDMGVTPYSLASFGNLRALSRRNDQPSAAVRPFDRDRDGMVLGEGGAVFVLQRADRARAEGCEVYAEVASVGMTSDAHHLVTPSPDPSHATAAVRQALEAARVAPDQIDYVNAHATGTPVGDACEARVLQAILGSHTRSVPVSSTKSMTGHLLGAAAAIETLACLTAIRYHAIPPTINLDHPDPQCDLHHVANTARQVAVRIAVSNAFGFGGHNTALVLRRAAA